MSAPRRVTSDFWREGLTLSEATFAKNINLGMQIDESHEQERNADFSIRNRFDSVSKVILDRASNPAKQPFSKHLSRCCEAFSARGRSDFHSMMIQAPPMNHAMLSIPSWTFLFDRLPCFANSGYLANGGGGKGSTPPSRSAFLHIKDLPYIFRNLN
jgi:hypothetical protein